MQLLEARVEKRGAPCAVLERDYVDPTTHLEKTLVEIWCQVLDIVGVGVSHNFFDLGGDMLRCVQVLVLAKKRGVQFSLQQFLQYPTIREISQVVQRNMQAEEERVGVLAGSI